MALHTAQASAVTPSNWTQDICVRVSRRYGLTWASKGGEVDGGDASPPVKNLVGTPPDSRMKWLKIRYLFRFLGYFGVTCRRFVSSTQKSVATPLWIDYLHVLLCVVIVTVQFRRVIFDNPGPNLASAVLRFHRKYGSTQSHQMPWFRNHGIWWDCVLPYLGWNLSTALVRLDTGGSKWRTISRWWIPCSLVRIDLFTYFLVPTLKINVVLGIKLCLYCWACLFCCEMLSVVGERRTASCMTIDDSSCHRIFHAFPWAHTPDACFLKATFPAPYFGIPRWIPPLGQATLCVIIQEVPDMFCVLAGFPW